MQIDKKCHKSDKKEMPVLFYFGSTATIFVFTCFLHLLYFSNNISKVLFQDRWDIVVDVIDTKAMFRSVLIIFR